jgi:uncharacterized protein with GYD domain
MLADDAGSVCTPPDGGGGGCDHDRERANDRSVSVRAATCMPKSTGGCRMAKYLISASYTAEGTKGLLKGGGGTARRAAVQQMAQAIEGRVEAFYYAFGDNDVYAILDVPDNVSIAAVSMAVNASGAVHTKTTVLLTAEEIDQAARKSVGYRAPGQ